MNKDELELLKEIPVLQNELDWVMEVIGDIQLKESVTSVIRQLSSKNDTTEWTRFHVILDSNFMDKFLELLGNSHMNIFS